MPVQPETTSATACASTQTLHERRLALQRCRSSALSSLELRRAARRASSAVGGAVAVAPLLGGCSSLSRISRISATSVLLLLPARPRAPSSSRLGLGLLALRARRAARRGRCPVAASRVQDRRARASDRSMRRCAVLDRRPGVAVWPMRHPRAGRVEHAHAPCRAAAGRRCSGARAAPPSSTASSRMRTPWCFSSVRARPRIMTMACVLGRLLDLHDLEAAGQRGVLLEVLLVLGPGRGGDGAQLAAGQRGLEQVGRVALPGLRRRRRSCVCASSMNRMIGVRRGLDLVDRPTSAGSRTRP